MLASNLFSWAQAWTGQLQLTTTALSSQSPSCVRTAFEAFEPLRSGPVPQVSDASEPQLSAPRFVEGMNASAGEQWAFDATSADGTSGLMLAFYHDPTYAFLGPGNLRLSLDLVFPNGSNWSLADYLSHADFSPPSQHASGSVVGPHSYRFFVTADNSLAAIELNTTRVQGTIRIRSMTPARPGPGASTWNAPGLHWASVIPAGQASVDLVLDGEVMRWEGMGGHERWWAGQGWLDGLQGWQAVRAVVGPYVLTYWAPTSRQAEGGVLWPSAYLARNGKTVLETRRSGPSSFQDDDLDNDRDAPYVEHRALTARGKLVASDGGSGDHRQGFAKGYVLMLIDPRTRRRWEFSLTLKNMEFAFDVGDSSGGVAYVGTASGGEIGDDVYHGVFFNESVYVAGLKVPRVYVWAAYWYYRVKASIFGY
ncbi:hypothetical protein K469DRAFT_650921 [Zopfia rhizophila CBS 207.26]|uniref:Uncharacterized protein n=1 Tax=Zopfia rhizophila CBS 207.26 TaxID=1314779 RepID=A0A6A6ESX0_9PEZI|nr:hypothetical protein K469DRAFT_650921 [Zopfia rhizophila CBS 207.26]